MKKLLFILLLVSPLCLVPSLDALRAELQPITARHKALTELHDAYAALFDPIDTALTLTVGFPIEISDELGEFRDKAEDRKKNLMREMNELSMKIYELRKEIRNLEIAGRAARRST